MSIIAPGRRINPTIQRRSQIGRKSVFAGLFLTSMVDMFAILVVFLLQSFSAEGELIVLPNGFQLPKAQNVGMLERAPNLIIAEDQITFEGKVVGKTPELANQDGWALPALQDALKEYREKAKADLAKKGAPPANPTEDEYGDTEDPDKAIQKINISADRRLEFLVVKKVIYNASFAGFPDFRFAVFAGPAPSTTPSPQH